MRRYSLFIHIESDLRDRALRGKTFRGPHKVESVVWDNDQAISQTMNSYHTYYRLPYLRPIYVTSYTYPRDKISVCLEGVGTYSQHMRRCQLF